MLYLQPDASLIYWPLLELEWTQPSAGLLNRDADEAKRGALAVATLSLTSSAPRYTRASPKPRHPNPL